MAARPDTVAANQGMAGGGRGMASYAPSTPAAAPMPPADVTGSVRRAAGRRRPATGAGTAAPPVTVAPGDTVESISRRYGVPASAIMQANNLTPRRRDPAGPAAGDSALRARRRSQTRCRRRAPSCRRRQRPWRRRSAASSPIGNRRRARGRARRDAEQDLAPLRQVARRRSPRPTTSSRRAMLKVGDRLVIPGVRTAQAAPKPGSGDRAGEARAGAPRPRSPPASRCKAPASSRRWRKRRSPRTR